MIFPLRGHRTSQDISVPVVSEPSGQTSMQAFFFSFGEWGGGSSKFLTLFLIPLLISTYSGRQLMSSWGGTREIKLSEMAAQRRAASRTSSGNIGFTLSLFKPVLLLQIVRAQRRWSQKWENLGHAHINMTIMCLIKWHKLRGEKSSLFIGVCREWVKLHQHENNVCVNDSYSATPQSWDWWGREGQNCVRLLFGCVSPEQKDNDQTLVAKWFNAFQWNTMNK